MNPLEYKTYSFIERDLNGGEVQHRFMYHSRAEMIAKAQLLAEHSATSFFEVVFSFKMPISFLTDNYSDFEIEKMSLLYIRQEYFKSSPAYASFKKAKKPFISAKIAPVVIRETVDHLYSQA